MTVTKLSFEDLPSDVRTQLSEESFFGSAGFARLWESMNGKPVWWAVMNHGDIAALLAGVEFGRGPFARFQAMPDGCYCRPIIFDRSTDMAEIYAQLLKAVGNAGYARAIIYDYYLRFPQSRDFSTTDCETSLVDISPPDWQPPDKKLQSEIRKAQREGVTILPFSAEKHLGDFLTLAEQTERCHGRGMKYPEQFYRRLAALADEDDRVRWLVVEYEDRLATSHIYFAERDLLLNWQVYFDRTCSFLKPNQYITYEVARDMAGKGVTTLNLGATPRAAGGLEFYKQRWGVRTYRYRCLQRKSWLGKLLR